MDRGGIGGPGDEPVEGIDLAHQMALAEPTNRRVAAHRADHIEIEAHQCDPRTHPRGDRRRLATRMAAANDNDVEAPHGRAH